MAHTEELIGTIDKIVYYNQENGYAIFTLVTQTHQKISIKGYAPSLQPGEYVTLLGSWSMHPKFGKQFDLTTCAKRMPDSIVGLVKYLGSGLIKGIGPVYAQKLVDIFGLNVLHIIDKEPDRLSQVPGIGQKRIDAIVKGWQYQKEISHIMVFLQERGVSTAFAAKIYKAYGARSIDVVTENPYRLADDVWGIGFKTADSLAQKMDFHYDSLKRITAGILYSLKEEASSKGSLYVEVDALKEAVINLLDLEKTEEIRAKLKMALHDLYNSQKIILISPKAQEHLVALTQYYYAEKGVAQRLQKIQKEQSRLMFDMHGLYTTLRIEHPGEITLNDDQQMAIINALSHKVSIITGGPGTGKTTVIKKIITLLEEYKVSYKLTAPTGRAAKRMAESTHRYAETVHRLLEFDPSIMGFGRNETNALNIDFLIVDESSMIDIFLALALLKAMPYHGHILFIGDGDQLPSVGAGNFFRDMIASGALSYVPLKHIFRQAHDSLIVRNAHRVNSGEFPMNFDEGTRRDFFFIKEDNPENVTMHIDKILTQILPRHKISVADFMILSPMKRGVVGTEKINADMQQMVNGDQCGNVIQYHGVEFRIHDRVMQLRNNYDKMVFNGDIGTITAVDVDEKKITVIFYDNHIEYEYTELDELTLAYAISIHKSQGSEYAAVVILIYLNHFTLLQRNLLYTAITRARKLCIVIGQAKAIGMAVKNNQNKARVTLLQQFLTTALSCR